MGQAGILAAQGDFYGAGKAAVSAGLKVVGKNNIKAAGKALLSKKEYQDVSKLGKKLKRGDQTYTKAMEGDMMGAVKTGVGKKGMDKMSHHVDRANHHTTQMALLHAAATGTVPASAMSAMGGGSSGRPRM